MYRYSTVDNQSHATRATESAQLQNNCKKKSRFSLRYLYRLTRNIPHDTNHTSAYLRGPRPSRQFPQPTPAPPRDINNYATYQLPSTLFPASAQAQVINELDDAAQYVGIQGGNREERASEPCHVASQARTCMHASCYSLVSDSVLWVRLDRRDVDRYSRAGGQAKSNAYCRWLRLRLHRRRVVDSEQHYCLEGFRN